MILSVYIKLHKILISLWLVLSVASHLPAQKVEWVHTGKWTHMNRIYAVDDSSNIINVFNYYYTKSTTLYDRTIGPYSRYANSGLVKTRPNGSTEWNLVFSIDTLSNSQSFAQFYSVTTDGKDFYAILLGGGRFTVRRNNIPVDTFDLWKNVTFVCHLIKISSSGQIVWIRSIADSPVNKSGDPFNILSAYYHKETKSIVLPFMNWDYMTIENSAYSSVKRYINNWQAGTDCNKKFNYQSGILVYNLNGTLIKERHLASDLYISRYEMNSPYFAATSLCDTALLDGNIISYNTGSYFYLDTGFRFRPIFKFANNFTWNNSDRIFSNGTLSYIANSWYGNWFYSSQKDSLYVNGTNKWYQFSPYEVMSFDQNKRLIKKKIMFPFAKKDTVFCFFQYGTVYKQFSYLTGYLQNYTLKKVNFLLNGMLYTIPAAPASNSPAYVSFVMKVDTLLNIVWINIAKKDYVVPGMVANDNEGSFIMQGNTQQNTTTPFLDSSITMANQCYDFIIKVSDINISLGDLKPGPYCAGDSIIIPYKLKGLFKPGNQIIAQLSDRNGEFDDTLATRELGRVTTDTSGIMHCRLPRSKIYTSTRYRIRLISTNPFGQNYFQMDSLTLYIISKDTIDPGPTVTICRGDTIELSTYGGMRWRWSNYNISDTGFFKTKVWPLETFNYRIIASDTTQCSEADTAYKLVIVRSSPKINFLTADTAVCFGAHIDIKAAFSGGIPSQYKWEWYEINKYHLWNIQQKDSNHLYDILPYDAPRYITDSIDLVLILTDGCSNLIDSSLYRVRIVQYMPNIGLSPSDTTICPGKSVNVIANFISKSDSKYYSWNWLEKTSPATYNRLEHDSGKYQDARVLKLPSNNMKSKEFAVTFYDNCSPKRDTAFVALRAKDILQLSPINDTVLCEGIRSTWKASAIGGIPSNYKWQWTRQGKIVSQTDSFSMIADSSTQISLTLSDQCMPLNDTVIFKVNVNPHIKTSILIGGAVARDTNLCFNQGLKLAGSAKGGNNQWVLNGNPIYSGDTFLFDPAYYLQPNTGGQVRLAMIFKGNCTLKSDSNILNIKVHPRLAISGTIKDSICFGANAVMKVTGTGGKGLYNYKWYKGGTLTQSGMDSLPINNNNASTTGIIKYSIILSDGCSANDTMELSGLLLKPLSIQITTQDTCPTSSAIITAAISGGKGNGYKVSWWQGATLLSGNGSSRVVIPGIIPVTYKAMAVDGCNVPSNTAAVIMASKPKLKLTVDGFCLGDMTIAKAGNSLVSQFDWILDGKSDPSHSEIINKVFGSTGPHKIYVSTSGLICGNADSAMFDIIEKPVADFDYVPDFSSGQGVLIQFINNSQNSNAWHWSFAQSGISNEIAPYYIFNKTGNYKTMLIASNNNICSDTVEKEIQVMEKITFFFPSVFSPDDNNINDGFGLSPDQYHLVKEYHLEIFNRWGEKVFQTNNVAEHWLTSSMHNKQEEIQQGVYMFKAIIKDILNQKQEISGAVELLR